MCYIIASTKNGVNKMTRDKYNTLINKIRMTSKYIDELMDMEDKMCKDVDNNTLDIKVRDILVKCMNDINDIYINSGTLETRLEAISHDILDKVIDNTKGTPKEEL